MSKYTFLAKTFAGKTWAAGHWNGLGVVPPAPPAPTRPAGVGRVPRLPAQDNRTQRFSQIVADILNSLIGQGYLVQTGPQTWTLGVTGLVAGIVQTFGPHAAAGPPGAADADRLNAFRAFLPHQVAWHGAAADSQGILVNQIFGG